MKNQYTEVQDDRLCIDIQRTEEFYITSQQLSDYIESLNLPQPQNDRLVMLAVEQVRVSEVGAFKQGFTWGVEMSRGL